MTRTCSEVLFCVAVISIPNTPAVVSRGEECRVMDCVVSEYKTISTRKGVRSVSGKAVVCAASNLRIFDSVFTPFMPRASGTTRIVHDLNFTGLIVIGLISMTRFSEASWTMGRSISRIVCKLLYSVYWQYALCEKYIEKTAILARDVFLLAACTTRRSTSSALAAVE